MFRIVHKKLQRSANRRNVLFNRYDRHYNNAILLQLSNFYQKKNNKVITYNAFDILQKSFLSTDNRGGGGGTKGPNKGNRGGQGRRGPNQRVPNNPGQNRGKKKGTGKDGNQPRMNSFYQKNNNNNNKKKNQGSRGQERGGKGNNRNDKPRQTPLSLNPDAFDASGKWIAPSQREYKKEQQARRMRDTDQFRKDNWKEGPNLRRKGGEEHATNKYINDGREHDLAPNRGGFRPGHKGRDDDVKLKPEYITHEDVLIYQLEDNVEFLKYVEKETAECLLKSTDGEDSLKFALRLLHLRASRIRFSDILKDAKEDLEYGFKVADIVKTIRTEETYSKHRWAMWSEKQQYEIGDIVTVATDDNFGRYLYKLTSDDASMQGQPGLPGGSGWKCYQFTDPYVYSKVDAMNEMFELYSSYGDDGIQFQQYIDGYNEQKPESKIFNEINSKRTKILHKYRDMDMVGTALKEFWGKPNFNIQKFVEMNREASTYFASLMLEISVEKELESLELMKQGNAMIKKAIGNDRDKYAIALKDNTIQNDYEISINNKSVNDYKNTLMENMNINYSNESGMSEEDFNALKEQFEDELNNCSPEDLKMHLYVKKKTQLIRDSLAEQGLDLNDLHLGEDELKAFLGADENIIGLDDIISEEDDTSYGRFYDSNKTGNLTNLKQGVLNYMEMQQKMSKNDRNLEMKRRLKEQYDGDELKKKLKIYDLVKEILDDNMSEEFCKYEDNMNHLYSKEGLFYDEFKAIANVHQDLKLNYKSGNWGKDIGLAASKDFYLYMNDETQRNDDKFVETDVYARYQSWKFLELQLATDFVETSHHFSGIQDLKDAEKEKEYQRAMREQGLPIPVEQQLQNELPDLFWNDQVPGEVIPIVQDKIYDLNQMDGEYWSAERLSQHFRVNPLRVKAILKIKNQAAGRVATDREEWLKFTKERDLVLNQVCEIWSKRLKQEHDGNIPSDFVVELKDIKDFVKNALKGLNEDADGGGGGAGGGGDDDDDDAEVDNEVEVEEEDADNNEDEVVTLASGEAHDDIQSVADPEMINDAKELHKLLQQIDDKGLWMKNKDITEMTTKTITNEDGEEEIIEVEKEKDIALEDRDNDYIFDVYDDAMNRAYLALFPLYFEQFVDQDLAGKAMRKNKPFAGLNEKDDMRKAKKKIIDRVNYIQRRRHRRKDETVGFSEKQPEGWTLDYIPLPTKKQYK